MHFIHITRVRHRGTRCPRVTGARRHLLNHKVSRRFHRQSRDLRALPDCSGGVQTKGQEVKQS